MKISELSAQTGVSVPSIKFYLREGLLPDGRLTSATQADYDEQHVARLRLIRALVGAAGVSVAETRALLAVLDAPPAAAYDLLGAAHTAVTPHRAAAPNADAARALLQRWGWSPDECDPDSIAGLAASLNALDAAGFTPPPDILDEYGRAVERIADVEIDGVPTDSPEAAVRYVVLGTVLMEPVLLALRRIAQQRASEARFGTAALRTESAEPPDAPARMDT